MKEYQVRIEKYAKQLSLNKSVSTSEAEKRAGDFLSAMAYVTDIRHEFSEEKIRLTSIQISVYAQELAKGTAKTMTENKVTAEASEEYKKAREELESIENDLSYLKAYYEIFQNGHIFFRQICKGEQF